MMKNYKRSVKTRRKLDMQRKFESNGCTYDVEIFQCGDTDIVRFYEERYEHHPETLNNLVIVTPPCGFLLIQYIGEDAVVAGTLNTEYFCEEMMDDIITFLENSFPPCRGICFPYHIDFVTVSSYAEYNGEY